MSGMPFRIIVLISACLLLACQSPKEPSPRSPEELDPGVQAALERMDEEFRRDVYEVTDGVYQAVGFGIANSIMVEGDECVFIVDTMGAMETAAEVRAEFAKITDKPIEALIYTLAFQHPFLYGLIGVLSAMLAGLVGWFAFRRD